MSQRHWMPLNVDDYLGDTGHLTAAEHGAYLLLIMRYWQDGGLPTDERMVARYSRLTPEQWSESRDVLAAFFAEGWKHARIDAEIAKAEELIEKRRTAANQRHSKSNAHAEQVQSNSSDTGVPQSHKHPSSLRSDGEARKRAARLPEGWVLPIAWRAEAIAAGLPPERTDIEARKMADWSVSSKNGARLDWHANWRNWYREAIDRLPQNRAPPKPQTAQEIAQDLLRTMGTADADTSAQTQGNHPALVRIPGPERARSG